MIVQNDAVVISGWNRGEQGGAIPDGRLRLANMDEVDASIKQILNGGCLLVEEKRLGDDNEFHCE